MLSTFADRLRGRAGTVPPVMVFPEGDDPRVVAAAVILAEHRIVHPMLLGVSSAIRAVARDARLDLPEGVRILEPHDRSLHARLAEVLRTRPSFATVSAELLHDRLNDPLALAVALVQAGNADGCVGGARRPTRDVLQHALRIVGLAEGVRIASSVFLMVLPGDRAITFADCAVVPEPDASQLADIATASARTHEQLTGQRPIVAMLSFSTKGSAEHATVSKVREATQLAQQARPELMIDGELQFDAAWVQSIGERKAPGSPVAGRANVFVFPDLNSGNIGYKLTERLAGAQAIGPLLQGLARPIHDLSRGCSVDDIVNVTAACALQAGSRVSQG